MTANVILLEELRLVPGFTGISEDDAASKPYAYKLLNNALIPEDLSIKELFKCIETAIYLGLHTTQLIQELTWKMGVNYAVFRRYASKKDRVWTFNKAVPTLVREEIDKTMGVPITVTTKVYLFLPEIILLKSYLKE